MVAWCLLVLFSRGYGYRQEVTYGREQGKEGKPRANSTRRWAERPRGVGHQKLQLHGSMDTGGAKLHLIPVPYLVGSSDVKVRRLMEDPRRLMVASSLDGSSSSEPVKRLKTHQSRLEPCKFVRLKSKFVGCPDSATRSRPSSIPGRAPVMRPPSWPIAASSLPMPITSSHPSFYPRRGAAIARRANILPIHARQMDDAMFSAQFWDTGGDGPGQSLYAEYAQAAMPRRPEFPAPLPWGAGPSSWLRAPATSAAPPIIRAGVNNLFTVGLHSLMVRQMVVQQFTSPLGGSSRLELSQETPKEARGPTRWAGDEGSRQETPTGHDVHSNAFPLEHVIAHQRRKTYILHRYNAE
ncbi:hypothetical protein DFH06DRAFT_1143444 [Mycena polygramma]|nr:hypothetical protein DFH06DRAFT_1143444 [Mycena polygramma]